MSQRFKTLVDVYQNSTRQFADRQLFGTKGEGGYAWTSYGQFAQQVEHFRGALATLGVGRGDTVAVICDNRVEWAVGAFATYTLGARYCPMYEAQSPKDWEFIIADSGARVLLVANETIERQVRPLSERIEALEHVVYFDGPRGPNSFMRLLGVGMEQPHPLVEVDEDEICALIYTSGTTGDPKGVLLSHRNIVSNIEAVQSFEIVSPEDVSLSFLPWAHAFGHTIELNLLFSAGAAMGLAESIKTIPDNLLEVRPTILLAVPRIFNRIYEGVHKKVADEGGVRQRLFSAAMNNAERLRDKQEDGGHAGILTRTLDNIFENVIFSRIRERFGGRLRLAISGGAALNPAVAHFIDNLNITVLEGYGLTETAPLISCNLPNARKIGSVGRPIPGVEVFIDTSKSTEEGTGEVCVRGPNVMVGYHNLADKTRAVLDDEHTFRTGDLGHIDEDGFLWLSGRIKDEFKLENGKYVAPSALEEQLQLSPFIDQIMLEGQNRPFVVALINVAKDELEEWAKAQGVSSESSLDDDAVKKLYLDEIVRLSADFKSYARPRTVLLVDDEWTPENGILTPTLKLKRAVVVERYKERLDALYASSK
ncbi:MAG: long-chain fatty acid--CoA ligase [Bradymonadaceae bacterium]|nr:long-chain fatty acid--CoA ligase [Lujinxingiaceae bacterium]